MDYDIAIALEANFGESYYNKGMAYRRKGKHTQAIQYFEQATSLIPNSAMFWYDRGVSHYQLRNVVEAENALAKAKELGLAPGSSP